MASAPRYCTAKPAGGGLIGMKCRKPLRPRTANTIPTRMRAAEETVLVRILLLSSLKVSADGIESRLKNCRSIHSVLLLCRAASVDKRAVRHSDKAKDRPQ